MISVVEALQFPPIARGALVLLIAGAAFPWAGVFVLRLHLVPLRFTLMHSALLGSAIALAIGTSPLWVGLGLNILLVLIIGRTGAGASRSFHRIDPAHMTTFFMVFTIGAAFAVLYRFDVPARESLSLLWGNIFALSVVDAYVSATVAGGIVIAVLLTFPRLVALLFDRDTAFTSGVATDRLMMAVLMMVGITITVAMGLIGALLLDALLILPAMIATILARGIKQLFLYASLTGIVITVVGFIAALRLDIPVSSGVTLTGAILFGMTIFLEQRRHER